MKKMLTAEVWTVSQTGEGHAVMLRTKDIAVPIFIGELEAQALLLGMEGLQLPRPMTHDLILNIIDSQKLTLRRVEIREMKDGVFYSGLVISTGRQSDANPLYLDCRPSDALCLAVRRKCPVLVSAEVASLVGIPIDLLFEAMEDGEEPSLFTAGKIPGENRRRLYEQLTKAVEREDYEEAAKIRDAIKGMEGG